MVSFGSILSAGLMMVMAINALPVTDSSLTLDKRGPDDCLGFRITSPQASGLKFTYGQCYEVYIYIYILVHMCIRLLIFTFIFFRSVGI